MADIISMLGDDGKKLLEHRCKGIPKESLHLPGPDYVDRVVSCKALKPGDRKSTV